MTGAQVLCKFGELKGLSSAALSSPVYIPPREESSGEERGLFLRTAAGDRAYCIFKSKYLQGKEKLLHVIGVVKVNFSVYFTLNSAPF